MTDQDDMYNGWKNKETWAANLWLANEFEAYCEAVDTVKEMVADGFSPLAVGDALVALLRDRALRGDDVGQCILRDVGSFWRIDEAELGGNWILDVEEVLAVDA